MPGLIIDSSLLDTIRRLRASGAIPQGLQVEASDPRALTTSSVQQVPAVPDAPQQFPGDIVSDPVRMPAPAPAQAPAPPESSPGLFHGQPSWLKALTLGATIAGIRANRNGNSFPLQALGGVLGTFQQAREAKDASALKRYELQGNRQYQMDSLRNKADIADKNNQTKAAISAGSNETKVTVTDKNNQTKENIATETLQQKHDRDMAIDRAKIWASYTDKGADPKAFAAQLAAHDAAFGDNELQQLDSQGLLQNGLPTFGPGSVVVNSNLLKKQQAAQAAAVARLTGVKADDQGDLDQSVIGKNNSEAGYFDSAAGKNDATTKEIPANAEADRYHKYATGSAALSNADTNRGNLTFKQHNFLANNPRMKQYIGSQYSRLNSLDRQIEAANHRKDAAIGNPAMSPADVKRISDGADYDIKQMQSEKASVQADIADKLKRADAKPETPRTPIDSPIPPLPVGVVPFSLPPLHGGAPVPQPAPTRRTKSGKHWSIVSP